MKNKLKNAKVVPVICFGLCTLMPMSAGAQEAINVMNDDGTCKSSIKFAELNKITFDAAAKSFTFHTLGGGQTTVGWQNATNVLFGNYQAETTGIAAPQLTDFSIVANGAIMKIACPDGIFSVMVYDNGGALLYSREINSGVSELTINNNVLKRGVCLVKVWTGNAVVTQKVIVK